MDLIRSIFYFLCFYLFLDCSAILADINRNEADFCRILLLIRIILLDVLPPMGKFQKNFKANQF